MTRLLDYLAPFGFGVAAWWFALTGRVVALDWLRPADTPETELDLIA